MPAQRTQLPEYANNEVRSRNAKPKADKPAKIGCMWTGISFIKRLIRDGSPVSVPQRCGLFPCCGGREEHDKTMHLTGTQWEKIWHPIYNSCGLRMAVSCCAAQPKSNAFLSFFFLWTKLACLLSHIACREPIMVVDQRIRWNKREQTAHEIQNNGLCWDSEHDDGILP